MVAVSAITKHESQLFILFNDKAECYREIIVKSLVGDVPTHPNNMSLTP
jgi:hypothetical protein